MSLTVFTAPSQSATLTGPLFIQTDPQTGQGGFLQGALAAGGTTPTASSQSASSANTPITMTSGIVAGGPNIIYVQPSGTSSASILLTPTSSASTSGIFQDGVEITLVCTAASASGVAIPSNNFGSFNVLSLSLNAGRAVRLKYIAALQTWIPLVNA